MGWEALMENEFLLMEFDHMLAADVALATIDEVVWIEDAGC